MKVEGQREGEHGAKLQQSSVEQDKLDYHLELVTLKPLNYVGRCYACL